MGVRVRQLTIDGRPLIALIVDGGFMIPLDRSDTMKLVADLQRQLMALPPAKHDE